jgi:hypothetical protein
MTQPPRKQPDGTWKQARKLVLILPKKPNLSLVFYFGSLANSQQNAESSNSTVPFKTLPNMKFVDYLVL